MLQQTLLMARSKWVLLVVIMLWEFALWFWVNSEVALGIGLAMLGLLIVIVAHSWPRNLKGVRLRFVGIWQVGDVKTTFTDYDIDHLVYRCRRESDYYWGFLRLNILQEWTESIQQYESRMR